MVVGYVECVGFDCSVCYLEIVCDVIELVCVLCFSMNFVFGVVSVCVMFLLILFDVFLMRMILFMIFFVLMIG